MAISFVAATSDAHTSSTSSLALNKPTGVQQGDVLIVVIGVVGETITNPSGWTTLETLTTAHAKGHLAYKVAGASEPSSYTWNLSQSQDDVAGSLLAFRDVDSDTPVRDSAVAEVNNTTTPASPALTGTQATDMVVAFGSGRSASSGPDTEITAPNTDGWTAAAGAHSGDSDPGSFPQSTDAAYQINGGTATFTSNANINTVMFAASLIAGAAGNVTGDLAVTAPAADADATGSATASATLDVSAPFAQAEIQADAIVAAQLEAVAPVAQVESDGQVFSSFLDVDAPAARVDIEGEVTYSATIDLTAPGAQVDSTAEVDAPGTVNIVAPLPQVSAEADVVSAGTLDVAAPSAGYTSDGQLGVAGGLSIQAPGAQPSLAGESDFVSSFIPVAPMAQVSIEVSNYGLPEVNFVIPAEERVTVVQSDIPRETFYV